MDPSDVDIYRVISAIHLLFSIPAAEVRTCRDCGRRPASPISASRFQWEATRCRGGHRQPEDGEPAAASRGVCVDCGYLFVVDVIEGRRQCKVQGCQRRLIVNTGAVATRLAQLPMLQHLAALVDAARPAQCAVCFDDFFIKPSEADPPTAACRHDKNICDDCLRQTYEHEITSGRVPVCPGAGCREPLSLQHLRSIVSRKHFNTYTRRLSCRTLAADPKFCWCSCGRGQIHTPGDESPAWKCASCQRTHCFVCREGDDECEHVAQFQSARAEDRRRAAGDALKAEIRRQREKMPDTLSAIFRTTKLCPRAGCRNRIERNGGCAHFRCGSCSTEFCWCCKVMFLPPAGGGRGVVPLHLDTCVLRPSTVVSRTSLCISGYAPGWDTDAGYDRSLDTELWLPDGYR